MRYPLDRLAQEVACIACHFHWSKNEIAEMSHRERNQWVSEIARINREMSEPSVRG